MPGAIAVPDTTTALPGIGRPPPPGTVPAPLRTAGLGTNPGPEIMGAVPAAPAPAGRPLPAPPLPDPAITGPGAGRRNAGNCPAAGVTIFNFRATAGVTPAVAMLGCSGAWPDSGRAWPNCPGRKGCATALTAREPVITLAGT